MKQWIVKFNSSVVEFTGDIPYDFQDAGIDWYIFRAISPVDAERQAKLYLLGKHPLQSELLQICRTLRVLAAESTDKARTYFLKQHPRPSALNYASMIHRTYSLQLEAIGLESGRIIKEINRLLMVEDDYKPRRPWVAEIVGLDPKFKFKRSFISHQTDYTNSSRSGDRGVYFIYDLRPNTVYEVHELLSRRSQRRYFCEIVDGALVELEEQDVVECLKKSGLA